MVRFDSIAVCMLLGALTGCTASEADLDRALLGRDPPPAPPASPPPELDRGVALMPEPDPEPDADAASDERPDFDMAPEPEPPPDRGILEDWVPIPRGVEGGQVVMMPTEVTAAFWDAATAGIAPSLYQLWSGGSRVPLGRVGPSTAAYFANLLSSVAGLPTCYRHADGAPYDDPDPDSAPIPVDDCAGVRLPTWDEFQRATASIAQRDEDWFTERGWFGLRDRAPREVAGKAAIGGLYDLIGNQRELVWDTERSVWRSCGCDISSAFDFCRARVCCPPREGAYPDACPTRGSLTETDGFRLVRTLNDGEAR